MNEMKTGKTGRAGDGLDCISPFADEPLALQMIYEVVFAAMQDDQDLAVVLTNRAYNQGIPLNDLRGRSRDALVAKILKVKPSTKDCDELMAIAQTVAILGEGMKISRELATAAKNATGF